MRRGGSARVGAGGVTDDDFLFVWGVFLLCSLIWFWRGIFVHFSSFLEPLRSQGRPCLVSFCKKCRFSGKGGAFVFANIIAIWLDFEDRECQKPENSASKLSSFYDVEKRPSKPFFLHFKFLFELILGSLFIDFWKVSAVFLWRCLGDRSGTASGSILFHIHF